MSCQAFIRDRVVLGPTLVVPVRVLWWDYLAYCETWGFEPGSAADFVVRMELEEGVKLRTGGHGRLRRCFEGIGSNAGSLIAEDLVA